MTVVGLELGGLLGGAVVTETVFAWPGVGKLTADAISARDYQVTQGVVLLLGAVFVRINLAVDLIYRSSIRGSGTPSDEPSPKYAHYVERGAEASVPLITLTG